MQYKVPLLSKIHLLISNELYVYVWKYLSFKTTKSLYQNTTVLTDEAFYYYQKSILVQHHFKSVMTLVS